VLTWEISFLLASTVLQPSFAALSHIFGRKYVSATGRLAATLRPYCLAVPCSASLTNEYLQILYFTIVLFAAGSLVAALANNFSVIIAGRTIQGLGGGGLIALTEMVVTDLVPLAFRGQWLSLLSAMWYVYPDVYTEDTRTCCRSSVSPPGVYPRKVPQADGRLI
jgi:MFS family permease